MIIDPRSVHPSDLPSVSIYLTKSLPELPGVYLAINGRTIEYVGSALNMKRRWANGHNKALDIAGLGDIAVAYAVCPDCDDADLRRTENYFIAWFDPLMNKTISPEDRIRLRHELYGFPVKQAKTEMVRTFGDKEIRLREQIGIREDFVQRKKRTDEEFDRFWAAVEKKVGKKEARISFNRATDVDLDMMIAALVSQQDYHKQKYGHLNYMKQPSFWLSFERWEDDVPQLDKKTA